MDFCFNPCCLIDLSEYGKKIQGVKFLTEIKKKYLEKYSDIIENKTSLIIRTGYDKWLEKNKKHIPEKIPYLDKEAADFISEFNLKIIGIDSLSVDSVKSQYCHKKFKNSLIVESLVNLYSIPENSRENFTLQTSPIKIKGASGGPISAYAFIKI